MNTVKLFWKETTMHGDPLCFVERPDGLATASLLFAPERTIALHSAFSGVEYEHGRDFLLDAATGLVTRVRGSRIPVITRDELYPSDDPDGSAFMFKRGMPHTWLMAGDGDLFHRRQVSATYTHRDGLWTGFVPPAYAGALPRTTGRLRAGDPLTIAVSGDSISEGFNASGFAGVPPFQPPYVDLVVAGLADRYASAIALHNFAAAGWTTDNGLADAARIGAVDPDLVLVAYGMNDAGYAKPGDYSANIAGIIDEVRRTAPAAEFVLVAPMLPNPEWHYPVMDRFDTFRNALEQLGAEGIALADVTTLWKALFVRKSFYDLTGNGINHPNDFGHQVYAQVVLASMIA
jgi:lysophospholipase L1-like esterase